MCLSQSNVKPQLAAMFTCGRTACCAPAEMLVWWPDDIIPQRSLCECMEGLGTVMSAEVDVCGTTTAASYHTLWYLRGLCGVFLKVLVSSSAVASLRLQSLCWTLMSEVC